MIQITTNINTFKDPRRPIGSGSRKLPRHIQQVALRKLFMLDKAATLDDLRIPPANQLEALHGDRKEHTAFA